MQFINDDEFQIHKQFLPLGVMRQNARVQHVGIGDNNVPLPANGLARVVGGVAIVGEGFDVGLQVGDQAVRFMHLVLRQRFGGKKIQRAGFRFIENTLQYRQVVAQRFAAGRRRHEHDILTIADEAHGLRLMFI